MDQGEPQRMRPRTDDKGCRPVDSGHGASCVRSQSKLRGYYPFEIEKHISVQLRERSVDHVRLAGFHSRPSWHSSPRLQVVRTLLVCVGEAFR